MTLESIHQRVLSLAAQRFQRDISAVPMEADLFETLQIDSFQAMELLTELERAFAIEVPDYELRGVTTFGALAELIRRRL
jgi:acyl carrier protein